LTVPAQALLLDRWKWIFLPQFQPARAVLFITAFAIVLGAVAGWQAALARRWAESAGWFFVVFALPANGLLLQLFASLPSDESARRRAAAVAICALSALAAAACARWKAGGMAALAAAALPFWLFPGWAEIRPFPLLHTTEMNELSAWAASTEKSDVFLFPDSGRNLAPGIFRAHAKRTLYVDWKGGGQVNLWRSFARDWQTRWFEHAGQCKPPLRTAEHYRRLGIRYLVVRPGTELAEAQSVFENEAYQVLDLR
jgi:hypothetical protein